MKISNNSASPELNLICATLKILPFCKATATWVASATMRTPLACKLSVMISPWKSFPIFLKEPI
jgi:hypothetical protein